ncbi:uncharacterized protein [Argopecten irradians]|uniref:uncharacterized protein isoform X1 n=1 Tax=Argopecten irradians TaxID=31199 RepID=UPI00371835C6
MRMCHVTCVPVRAPVRSLCSHSRTGQRRVDIVIHCYLHVFTTLRQIKVADTFSSNVVFYTSFRSLVDRVVTSLAVVVSRGLSLAEAVVVFATCCCRGEVFPVPAADQPSSSSVVPAVPVPASPAPIRRSGRATRRPAWHKDYVM